MSSYHLIRHRYHVSNPPWRRHISCHRLNKMTATDEEELSPQRTTAIAVVPPVMLKSKASSPRQANIPSQTDRKKWTSTLLPYSPPLSRDSQRGWHAKNGLTESSCQALSNSSATYTLIWLLICYFQRYVHVQMQSSAKSKTSSASGISKSTHNCNNHHFESSLEDFDLRYYHDDLTSINTAQSQCGWGIANRLQTRKIALRYKSR